VQVWWSVSTAAPDSSSWPAGSSVTEAPSFDSAMTRPGPSPIRSSIASEARQALQQGLDATIAIEGRRTQVVQAETELLVLGADAPVLRGLLAGSDVVDQLRTVGDQRVGDVAGAGQGR
jgi:hypothetical protein